jgi:Ca2+-binding RTX toxin-like protein
MGYLASPFTYSTDVTTTIGNIVGSGPANAVVFFTDTKDGWLYVNGGSFNGTLIKLAGVTAAPKLADLSGPTSYIGSTGNDIMAGTDGADAMDGAAGADTLIGGAGADTLTGGTGADRFVYTLPGDSLRTAPDTIVDFLSGTDKIELSGGNGYYLANGAFAFDTTGATPADRLTNTVSNIIASSAVPSGTIVFFTDTTDGWLYVKGNGTGGMGFNNTLIKLAGVTTPPATADIVGTVGAIVVGTDGSDTLAGTSAAEIISAGAGNDTLTGGGGADTLIGGAGSDVFRLTAATDSATSAPDIIVDFVSGTDKIALNGATGYHLLRSYTLAAGADAVAKVANTITAIEADTRLSDAAVFLTDGSNGWIYVKGAGTGTSYAGTLVTLAGVTTAPQLADFLGIEGEITIGTAGADILTGSSGSDVLLGGDGNDTLTGGGGSDTLAGGNGGDVFRLTAGTDSTSGATDVITDFVAGTDKIDLVGAAGYRLLRSHPFDTTGADTAAKLSNTITVITGDPGLQNCAVFLTYGGNGWL